METFSCAQAKKYGEVSETLPINFTEDDVTWVASKISCASYALGEEAIELYNWLLCFGCVSEELRIVVSILDDCMANSSPPWAAYFALMACCLLALDKRPGVCPVGLGETLRRDLAKLVMRAARYQAKTACGNLQLCAGLEDGIEGAAHDVCQRRMDRVRAIRNVEEDAGDSDEE